MDNMIKIFKQFCVFLILLMLLFVGCGEKYEVVKSNRIAATDCSSNEIMTDKKEDKNDSVDNQDVVADVESEVALFKAGSNNWNKVKEFLESGGNINIVEKERCLTEGTFLHNAIRQGELEIVKYLLIRGANLELRNALDMTPLHYAVRYNKFEIVKILLEHGADVKAETTWGRGTTIKCYIYGYKVPRDSPKTVLQFAQKKGDDKMLQIILAAIDVD